MLIQPSSLDVVDGLGFVAVITVLNTSGVSIENLAVDASKSGVSGCTPGLADIHFHNASGTVEGNAIFGAQLSNPLGCTTNLPFGNGFGVLVQDAGVKADIEANVITGVGPSGGVFQFGVFIANGAVGQVRAQPTAQIDIQV